MLKPALSLVLALTAAVAADRGVPGTPPSAATVFVGATPCDEPVRRFLGISNAACEQIAWKLSLGPDAGTRGSWELHARYHMPVPGSPNRLDGGKELTLMGGWTSAPGTGAHAGRMIYTLTANSRSLRLALMERDLLQLLAAADGLMAGNAGWSYTLNRREPSSPRAARQMEAFDATGLAGEFEGRTPCQEISRQLNLAADGGCIKLKWGFTFFQDAATGRPTTYRLDGTLYRDGRLQAAAPRIGKWSVLRDRSSGALIYRLERDAQGYMLLMRADENVLFFLDKEGNALVGNESFSYTLNRTASRD